VERRKRVGQALKKKKGKEHLLASAWGGKFSGREIKIDG